MKVGVFGGSFNPVHNGHIAVARAAVASGLVDKVLMVLSPLNPLKANPEELLDDKERLAMLADACRPFSELEACDIELSMPRPSYTIDTLRKLQELNPDDKYRLIIGADNFVIFPKWRDAEDIIARFAPIVYPREGFPMPPAQSGFTPLDAPLFPLSSTEIRRRIRHGEPVNDLLPPSVLKYILTHNLYSSSHS